MNWIKWERSGRQTLILKRDANRCRLDTAHSHLPQLHLASGLRGLILLWWLARLPLGCGTLQ